MFFYVGRLVLRPYSLFIFSRSSLEIWQNWPTSVPQDQRGRTLGTWRWLFTSSHLYYFYSSILKTSQDYLRLSWKKKCGNNNNPKNWHLSVLYYKPDIMLRIIFTLSSLYERSGYIHSRYYWYSSLSPWPTLGLLQAGWFSAWQLCPSDWGVLWPHENMLKPVMG